MLLLSTLYTNTLNMSTGESDKDKFVILIMITGIAFCNFVF